MNERKAAYLIWLKYKLATAKQNGEKRRWLREIDEIMRNHRHFAPMRMLQEQYVAKWRIAAHE